MAEVTQFGVSLRVYFGCFMDVEMKGNEVGGA